MQRSIAVKSPISKRIVQNCLFFGKRWFKFKIHQKMNYIFLVSTSVIKSKEIQNIDKL